MNNVKLKFEHIAPYLPHGLKVQYQGTVNLKELSDHQSENPYSINPFDQSVMQWYKNRPKNIIGDRISLIKDVRILKDGVSFQVGNNHGYTKKVYLQDIKPILKSLSWLTKDLSGSGQNIISWVVATAENHCDAYDEWLEIFIDNPIPDRLLQAPFEIVNYLFEKQYDVFDLICQGLAIEMEDKS